MPKDHSSASEEGIPEESTMQQETNVSDLTQAPRIQAQPNQGQPITGQSIQWLPVQMAPGPWFYGPSQVTHGEQIPPDGGSPTAPGAGSSTGPGLFYADRVPESGNPGLGSNPYPVPRPGYFPYSIVVASGRPEPGDPLYTTTADGPELRLIAQQLIGADNYSS